MKILWILAGLTIGIMFGGCARHSDGTNEKVKSCFHCMGSGKIPCPNGTNGLMDCPGPCLKLSQGEWVHLNIEGHPATDIWRRFATANGGWQAWNQSHVGDVIEYRNGDPVDTGKCKICGGTGRVKCTVCDGTGEETCPICDGKKLVPESWTAFDNPKVKNRPTHFTLKDGRTLVGKKIIEIGDDVTLRTENGNVAIKKSDIVSEDGGK